MNNSTEKQFIEDCWQISIDYENNSVDWYMLQSAINKRIEETKIRLLEKYPTAIGIIFKVYPDSYIDMNDHEVSVIDAHVIFKRIETDDELHLRLKELEWRKENRYKTYLNLKKEFENDPNNCTK